MFITRLIYRKAPVTKQNILISVALISAVLIQSSNVFAEDDKSLATFKPEMPVSFVDALKNADLKAGEKYFDRKCATCHDAAVGGKHNMGPLLWGWFGRQAGTADGFEYSQSMKSSAHEWNFATLNYYLSNTERAVPGKTMNFRGIKSEKSRANLLAYLAQFNASVPKIPE